MSFGLGFGFPGTVAAGSGATLALQFAGATALDPRITFTRASSATFTNSAGLVASAATNVARLDYDPVTRQPKGLLIEEARTNVILYSGAISVANGWATDAVSTLATNQATAPDGTLTASQLQYISNKYIYQNKTVTTATAYTWSLFVKLGTGGDGTVNLDHQTGAGYFSSTFNLLTRAVTSGTGVIQNVGNGWYRCSLTYTTTSTNDLIDFVMNGTFTAGQGHYIWGAQLEAGAFATSYIPTVAAQATRAAENAVMTGTNFSSWYNQTEGTLCAQSQSVIALNVPSGVASGAACISDGTVSNRVDLRLQSGGSSFVSFVSTAGVTQATLINSGTYAPNSLYKMAVAYKVNDFARVTNAGAVEIDTSGSVPNVIDQLAIGFLNTVNTQTNGTIRSITYWPRRLSNAELQAVTS